MRQKARPVVERSGLDVEFIDAPAENIPLPPDSVDTVVISYTLCTIPDAAAALESVRRVLRPGGRLLFCEHGLAPDAAVRRWQRRLSPAWSHVAGGCNMDRDIPALLDGGGFETILDERMYIPGLRVLSYNYWGIARALR
jgi:ubiquinone/menaquinone biosynthesis C-methylase UbiE